MNKKASGACDSGIDDSLSRLVLEIARTAAPQIQKMPRVICEPSFIGDWIAYDDNTYDGPGSLVGYGDTKHEAIEDLLIEMEERYGDDKRETDTTVRDELDLADEPDDEPEEY